MPDALFDVFLLSDGTFCEISSQKEKREKAETGKGWNRKHHGELCAISLLSLLMQLRCFLPAHRWQDSARIRTIFVDISLTTESKLQKQITILVSLSFTYTRNHLLLFVSLFSQVENFSGSVAYSWIISAGFSDAIIFFQIQFGQAKRSSLLFCFLAFLKFLVPGVVNFSLIYDKKFQTCYRILSCQSDKGFKLGHSRVMSMGWNLVSSERPSNRFSLALDVSEWRMSRNALH